MVFALIVFAAMLALFALDLLHRPSATLAGAILLIVKGACQEEAIEAVHREILGLLVGRMILVDAFEESGIFGYPAIKSARLAVGRPGRVLIYLVRITAKLSAFLDGATNVLFFPATKAPSGSGTMSG